MTPGNLAPLEDAPVTSAEEQVIDLPPDEPFWEKYSSYYEFPLSTFAAIAAHIFAIGTFIVCVNYLRDDHSNVSPPIRSLVVGDGEAAGDGTSGSGGGEAGAKNEDDNPEPVPPIPEAQFQEIQTTVLDWAPELQSDPEMVKAIARSPEFDKLKQVNDELRKKLMEGFKGKQGKGKGDGQGNDGSEGTGSSGKGDGTTTGERSLRWNLIFQDYRQSTDYLRQISLLRGKIIYPLPPTGERYIALTDFKPGSRGEEVDLKKITEMYYICSEPDQVRVLVDALELKFLPKYYVLLLPRDVEEHLAAVELAYQNKKSDEISSTTFKFVERDGKMVPVVVKQQLRRGR